MAALCRAAPLLRLIASNKDPVQSADPFVCGVGFLFLCVCLSLGRLQVPVARRESKKTFCFCVLFFCFLLTFEGLPAAIHCALFTSFLFTIAGCNDVCCARLESNKKTHAEGRARCCMGKQEITDTWA